MLLGLICNRFKPAEIKKANKLWTSEDIFARKELIIPTSHNHLQHQQSRIPLSMDTIPPEKKSLVHKFMEITQRDEKFSFQFLVDRKWNFVQALTVYYSQEGSGGKAVDSESDNALDSKSLKEEEDEIWEEKSNHHAKIHPPMSEGKR